MRLLYFYFFTFINVSNVIICEYSSIEYDDLNYFDILPGEKALSFNQIKNYCNVYINDLRIKLNRFKKNRLLKAFFNDHLTFECDIENKFEASNFDWSVNGLFLGINEPEYMLFLDKKIESNDTYLNITFYYWIPDIGPPQYFNFPAIHLDRYIFEPKFDYISYLKEKYKIQIKFLLYCFYLNAFTVLILFFLILVFKLCNK